MRRRGTIVCGLLALTVSSFCAAQEPAWKARFAEFARSCGVDPSSKSRFFHNSLSDQASDWAELCDPQAAKYEGAWDDAEVWTATGRAKLVSIVRSSQSGDWSFANYYCFRTDGSLESVVSTYATSYADVPFDYVRSFKFDQRGRVISQAVRYFRIGATEVMAKPPELDHIHEFAKSVPAYKTISELPVAGLLNAPNRCSTKKP